MLLYASQMKEEYMRANNGFTLIEVIVGITIMAIVLTSITSLIAQQITQSAGQVIQLKANELGRTMINEILSRSFDEKSQRSHPFNLCGGSVVQSCTAKANFGTDVDPFDTNNKKETRDKFNDVDDFDSIDENSPLQNSLGEDISADYPGFSLEVIVVYDDNLNGRDDDEDEDVTDSKHFKLITVEVFAPNNQTYGFSAYKGNY